jgi:hypothetical protein
MATPEISSSGPARSAIAAAGTATSITGGAASDRLRATPCALSSR